MLNTSLNILCFIDKITNLCFNYMVYLIGEELDLTTHEAQKNAQRNLKNGCLFKPLSQRKALEKGNSMSKVIETAIDELLAENENIVLIKKKTVAGKTVKIVYQNEGEIPVLPDTDMADPEKLTEMEVTLAGICSYLGSKCVELAELLYDRYLKTDKEVTDESVLEFCDLARDINDWRKGHKDCLYNPNTPWWESMLPVLEDYKFLLMWGTAVQANSELDKTVNVLWEAAWGALMAMRDEKVCRVAILASLEVGKKVEQVYLPNKRDDDIYILVRMNGA